MPKPKKTTSNKSTEASAFLLLDRSGSMQNLWVEAIGSINTYANKLAESLPHAKITLAVFDSGNRFEIVRDAVEASKWRDVSNEDAMPRGSTPLYDAVVSLCADANKKAKGRTSLVVMTDGHENASQEATKDTAKSALDATKAKGWDVVFLGANWDAMDQSASVGVMAATTLNVGKGKMRAMAESLSERTVSYSTGMASANASWSADVRQKTRL